MSALLQPSLFRSLRGVSEQEAIMTISRLALAADDIAGGLEALSSVALRLNGLQGVEVRLHGRAGEGEVLEWHASQMPSPKGAATALIAANSREWGRLRILFEPRVKSVECPLRFARILGQQVALMLNRLELLMQNKAANAAVRRLEQRLDTRKAVSRAAGIMAEIQNLTHQRALLLLLRQARETRRSPLALAHTVILTAGTGRSIPRHSQFLHR